MRTLWVALPPLLKKITGLIEICMWIFSLMGASVVSVLQRAVESFPKGSQQPCNCSGCEQEAGLCTLALTHWHLAFVPFCYQSFVFSHPTCPSALGLSSCGYLVPVVSCVIGFIVAGLHHWEGDYTSLQLCFYCPLHRNVFLIHS